MLTFFIAGLLYLLRFERVDNLGAYSIPSETGLLIPSVNVTLRCIVTPVIYVSATADGTMGNVVGSKSGMTLKRQRSGRFISASHVNAFALVMALVVFAVLACCMTTMGYHHSGEAIDLPKVLHPSSVGGLTWGVNRHDAMIISVSRSGGIFMQNDRVPSSALAAKIHQRVSEGAEPKIYIRADARARYSSVKSVLDEIQAAGVKDVSFLADERRLAP